MKPAGPISRQLTDLLAYVLIPLVAVVTPAAFSRGLLRRASGWNWFLGEASRQALSGARKHGAAGDGAGWLRGWIQVELMDVRDLYMMMFGRARSVLGEIEVQQDIEMLSGRLIVGMHWGPGISLLRLMDARGLEPSFPYRPPERALRRSRPFYYLSSWLAERYLSRTLGERAVSVGGAGKAISALLEGDSSICVLMDAPPMTGRKSARRTVLGNPARFNTGFPALLAKSGKEYFLVAMNLKEDGSLLKQLELSGPYRAGDGEVFLDEYAAFLDRHLRGDAWHWRMWHAEGQFWD